MKKFFTSESVSEGHPDKIADQISDAILDAFLEIDPNARVAVETMVTTGLCVLSGEVKLEDGYVDVQKIARETIKRIGYTKESYQFSADSCGVISAIHDQSEDISLGVDGREDKQLGAGDQGMMFGYATDETPTYMPLGIQLAHDLVRELAKIRKEEPGVMDYLRPDSKSQVTVEYDENDKPVRIDTIVLSTQHDDDVTQAQIAEDVKKILVPRVIPAQMLDGNIKYHVNPTGKFVIGGPHGDTGLTGRKIIVDTYGGHGAHGGGAFSGKDPSKVDRSAAYAARHIAKNIVAAGLAQRCLVQLAYAIGVNEPISIFVDTYGTGKVEDYRLADKVRELFDCTPGGIIDRLDLKKPIYSQTAAYGHFGREEFSWEKLDYVEQLKAAF
jgi:S-adenosylmethionine synthetase